MMFSSEIDLRRSCTPPNTGGKAQAQWINSISKETIFWAPSEVHNHILGKERKKHHEQKQT